MMYNCQQPVNNLVTPCPVNFQHLFWTCMLHALLDIKQNYGKLVGPLLPLKTTNVSKYSYSKSSQLLQD